MTKIEARYILWDHDGVLVDTERWYYEATAEALGRLGIELDEARHLAMQKRGVPSWELARDAGIDEATIVAQRARRNARYQEYLLREDIEIPGVEEVLATLGRRHEMAIVTTSKRVDFELIHRSRTIVQHMAFVLTLEDYPTAKPAPDPYLAGLARFGARADEAVVIEDSERGLRSAVAAGIRCVVVDNAFTRSQDFSAAERVVGSLRELPSILGAS